MTKKKKTQPKRNNRRQYIIFFVGVILALVVIWYVLTLLGPQQGEIFSSVEEVFDVTQTVPSATAVNQ